MTSRAGDRPPGPAWRLVSAVERRAREGPSFEIPGAAARESLRPGDGAKLLFELRSGVERMWAVVLDRRGAVYRGRLVSTPAEEGAPVAPGLELDFGPEHVAGVDLPPLDFLEGELGTLFVERVRAVRSREPGE